MALCVPRSLIRKETRADRMARSATAAQSELAVRSTESRTFTNRTLIDELYA